MLLYRFYLNSEDNKNYSSLDGMSLSFSNMQHYETLKLMYIHKYNNAPSKKVLQKNPCLSIIPAVINKKIISTIMLDTQKWFIYDMTSKYIIISNTEWIAYYHLSLNFPKYKHFGFNLVNMNIYDSIYYM